ncbi:MAG: hypothetical protein LBQ66_02405 [Planctomycetaceae bacterium]|nr:hypothetical protein [Planctomycetaceae bacterium]
MEVFSSEFSVRIILKLKTKTSVWSDIVAPLGRRLFAINYRRALPYAMIF